MAITVIDAMMGSGKTQAMYQMIRTNPDKSYMIVTPYLKTIQDAKMAGLMIREPEYKGGTKLDSLKYLLSHGYNIGCTHSLFLDVDSEVWNLVWAGEYTLFIDEALDVVKPINDLIDDVGYKVKAGTAAFLIQQGVISVDELCRVSWCGKSMDTLDYEYRYLEPYIKNGNVLCVNGQLFLWVFPPKIFEAFSDIYILSYLFEGSVFDAYLKIHGLNYSIGGVSGHFGDKGGFIFCEYNDDSERRLALKQAIKIYKGKANKVGEKRCALSVSWYDTAKPTDLATVRRGFNTFYKSAASSQKRLMWTVYKDAKEAVCIDGSKYIRKLTADENKAMNADLECKDVALNKLRCFVSCNAKATNDYDDRNMLAYLINRFYNPMIKRMFKEKYNIILNEERYALSEMIQWIWRSSIRRSDVSEQIDIYIPSKRMRTLYEKWLDGKCV